MLGLAKMQGMTVFYDQLFQHLQWLNRTQMPTKKWTMNFVARKADIPSGHPSLWKKPRDEHGRRPSDTELEKIADIKELGLGLKTLKAWRAADEYGLDVLQEAIQILKEEEK
jgi:hypothetical protein